MPASWSVRAALRPAIPPPTIAMREVPAARAAAAASAPSGPLSAAAPTVAPPALRKSRRLRRICLLFLLYSLHAAARPISLFEILEKGLELPEQWSARHQSPSLRDGCSVERNTGGNCSPRPKKILGNADRRHDLLLVVRGVALVVGADEGRDAHRATDG